MGRDGAVSPAMFTSAVTIEPQVNCPALGNTPHSNDGPAAVLICGSDRLRVSENSRSPVEPVSTMTLLIVWHVLVPGIHTVTLAETTLIELFPELTVTGKTFGIVGGGGGGPTGVLEDVVPHASDNPSDEARVNKRSNLLLFTFHV